MAEEVKGPEPKQKGGPSAQQVRIARLCAKHTTRAAALTIYCSVRQWQKYESGGAFMSKALFELYRLKTGQF